METVESLLEINPDISPEEKEENEEKSQPDTLSKNQRKKISKAKIWEIKKKEKRAREKVKEFLKES